MDVSPEDILRSEQQLVEERACPLCERLFKGVRGLTSHLALSHGVFPEAALFVQGTGCPACQKDFHCRRRAVRHIQRSPGCLAWLKQFTRAVVPTPHRSKQKQSKVWLRAVWKRPCTAGCIQIDVPSSEDEGFQVRTAEQLLAPT